MRVRGFYRTSRSSGYGYGSLTELPEVPGMWHGRAELTELPSGYKNDVPLPRVLLPRAYRTSRSFGYGYECRTELPEVPGTGINVLQNIQKFFVG